MAVDGRAGERVGPYRLTGRLGEGGMGVVYRAVDDTGREVALKLLRPELAEDATFRRRLAREVDTMRRVRDRHVAEVLDADISAERPYIVTRFIDGHSLEDTVRATGPLAGRSLARVATGLATAVAAIHEAGVVHRDLKPNNVMLVDGVPVVIDFGIAHAADSTRLTQTGMIVGTPGYIAPEIIDGHPPGQPVDVYAWAATVAFAATGRCPFGTGSLESVLARVVAGRPDLQGVPPRLTPILAAALVRDPARRPSAGQVVSSLRGADFTAPVGVSAERPARPRPRVRLGWYKLLAYLMILIVVCLSMVAPPVFAGFAVLAAWYLRAGDSAVRSRRIPVRSTGDLIRAPLRLPRSLGRATLVLVPCLLYAGAIAGVVIGAFLLGGAARGHAFRAPEIARWAVAAFTYMTLAGMGLMGPRRQLVRLISEVSRARWTTVLAVPMACVLALLAVGVVRDHPPHWWPGHPPYSHLGRAADNTVRRLNH